MLKKRSLIYTTLVSLSLAIPVSALAQQGYPMANPGAIIPPTVDPIPQPTRVEDPLLDENSRTRIDVPDQPVIVQVDKDVFQVNTVEVQGNSIITSEDMRRIVSPYEGKQLTANDLAKLVNEINAKYRLRGYLTSLAFIPPQDLERGTITVRVLEGIVGDMEVAGNKYFKARVIEKKIAETPGQPLNIPALEKELMRINRQEPFKLKATLSPGDEPGETKIRFDVKEQQPFQIALTADNAGRPFIGTYRFGGELIDRNVTGHGDRANVRYLVGAGQHIATASYTYPLNSRGTELSGLFGFSHVDLDTEDMGIAGSPQVIGRAFNYGLLLSHPLDIERTWVADIGLNARRATSLYENGRDRDETTDDVRSLALGLNFNKYDNLGRTFARLQSTFAPNILGANTSFWKMESFVTRVTRLPKNNLLILRAYSQWTPDDLPPIEQFQLGGVNTVRGYTEGLLLGDKGYSLSAEWRWPVPFLSAINPWLGERVQGALFFDYGQAWLDKSSRFYRNTLASRRNVTSLASAGMGVRAHLTDYLQGYVDVAFGLLDRGDVEPNAQPTARVHFGVRSELLPNDYKTRSNDVTPIKTDVFRPRSVGSLQVEELQSEVSDPTLEPMDKLMNPFRVY